MDETGQSGDTGAVAGGPGAEARDRTLLNGWATSDGGWSGGTAAREAEDDVPAWRRPFTRPFGQRAVPASRAPLPPGHSSGDYPFPDVAPTPYAGSGEIHPFGDAGGSGEIRPYANGSSAPQPYGVNGSGPFGDQGGSGEIAGYRDAGGIPPLGDPGGAEDRAPESNGHGPEASVPTWSEGRSRYADLFAQRAAESPTRAILPAVRPATPGGRRVDWSTAESARHAREPGHPAGQAQPTEDPGATRPPYDPGGFPAPYEPGTPSGAAPSPDNSVGYAAASAYPGYASRSGGALGAGPDEPLPQRVPAEPDVPTVPEPPSVEPSAETPALARIATHLRRGDVLSAQDRQEGFDVQAILAAVREVAGVRDASLRTTPAGAHSLRLDLADGADPAEVSRQVARLLQDRMGLDAAMQGGEAAPPNASASAPPAVPFVPNQPTPAGRDSLGDPAAPAGARAAGGPASVPAGADPLGGPSLGGGMDPLGGPAASGGMDPLGVPAASTGLGEPRRRLPQPARPADSPIAGAPPGLTTPLSAPPATEYPATPTGPASASPAAPFSAAPPRAATQVGPAAGATRALERTAFASGPGGAVEAVVTGVNGVTARPLDVGDRPGPRVVIENVQVSTFGMEATVEVRLAVGSRIAAGEATGPAVDGYLLRLCAMATARAVDELLSASEHADGPARCFVEHAATVPFGPMQVAVVVLLLSYGGWVEQIAGSAVVTGDDRHAMVRATLAAVNRRLEALLS
ncbi:hypothetical protein EV385_3705 [Krasilnikovia cinnamomea]|uniref:Uncharacterized protein n=1 Tax=Krasilnikovia cinnamomea TaxID=349313 RepID=A0A4Q7ZNK7_9ACTN|nr:Daple [Krasilnikovia cinnamomea]RZU51869.1 hypothetical protein EV385_3705 [Krasilnikovia cinnamomea]